MGVVVRKFIIGAVLAVLTVANAANAAEVVVFCPGAVQSVVRDIVKSYEQKTGNTVKFEFGTAGAAIKKVADGMPGDVVITTNKGLAGLAKSGKVDGASIRDLGSMGVGVAVKIGAPKPDIRDVEFVQEVDAGGAFDHVRQPGERRTERHSHCQSLCRNWPR